MFYQVQFNLTKEGAAHIHLERYLRMTEIVVAGRSYPTFEEQAGDACIHLGDEGLHDPYEQWGMVPARGLQELHEVLRYLLIDRWGGDVAEIEQAIEEGLAELSEDHDPVLHETDPGARFFHLESSATPGKQIELVVRLFDSGDCDDGCSMATDVVASERFNSLPTADIEHELSVMITEATWTELKGILKCQLTCQFGLGEEEVDGQIDEVLVKLSGGEYTPGQLSDQEVLSRFREELADIMPSDITG